MNIYLILSYLSEVVHLGVVAILLGSIARPDLFKQVPLLSRALVVTAFSEAISQIVFLGNCPLTILSKYLAALGRGKRLR
jgi:hypothetical protein